MPFWSALGNPYVMLGFIGVAIGVVVYDFMQSKKQQERAYRSRSYHSRSSGHAHENSGNYSGFSSYESDRDHIQTVRKRKSDIGKPNDNEQKKIEFKRNCNQNKSDHPSNSSSSEKSSTVFPNSPNEQNTNLKGKNIPEKQTRDQKDEFESILSSRNNEDQQMKYQNPSSSEHTTSSSGESSGASRNCDDENQKLKNKRNRDPSQNVREHTDDTEKPTTIEPKKIKDKGSYNEKKPNRSSSSSDSEKGSATFQNSHSEQSINAKCIDKIGKQTRDHNKDDSASIQSSNNDEKKESKYHNLSSSDHTTSSSGESSSTSHNCDCKNQKLKNKGNLKKRRGKQEREVSDTTELSNNDSSKSSKHRSSSSEKSYKNSGHKKVESWIRNQENLTSDSTQSSSNSESEFQSTSSSSEYQPFVPTKSMNMQNATDLGSDVNINSPVQENNLPAGINDNVCKSCNDDTVTTINEPCEHGYLCSYCAPRVFQRYKKCYICKGTITGFKNIEK